MFKYLLNLIGFKKLKTLSPRSIVFVTGCDSGLGYNMALFCHSLNLTVVSGCRDINSDGANLLRKVSDSERMITVEIDLLKQDTIENVSKLLTDLIETKKEYEFLALVNNAGVMCFGEFEWQTRQLFEYQINVNVLGTMRLTKVLLPLIRRQKGRIINITSHCGIQALPGLAPYVASKSALRFWTDSLRIELNKYGVKVINFIPGSFVGVSNILAGQQEHAKAMLSELSPEQESFYGDYIMRYNEYLKFLSGYKTPNIMNDEVLLEKFKDALTNSHPKALYIHEPWRYKFYRLLFTVCPTSISDWLAVKFCGMPEYRLTN